MTQLGKYDILEEIGRGGFGIVYKARDTSLNRLVALKVLHPQLTVDTRFIENFKREARNLAKINHNKVVTVYEIAEQDGRMYIAMAYLSGGSLAEKIAAGSLEQEEALRIVCEVAEGLAAGHEKGIIHRDVKPANIIFDEKGRAVVTDFGVAKAVHLSTIGTTSVSSGMVGTPYYRPPELWRGKPKPSPATDVYSLGCVLYEMLTGEVLFTGEAPDQVMTCHVLEDAKELMRSNQIQVPARIQPVLEKALSKDPSQRYQSMGAFMKALKQSQEKRPVNLKAALQKTLDHVVKPMTAQEKPIGVGKPASQRSDEASISKPARTEQAVEKEKATETGLEKPDPPKWLAWGAIGLVAAIILIGIGIASLGGGNRAAQEAPVAEQPAEEEQAEITEESQEEYEEEIIQETEELMTEEHEEADTDVYEPAEEGYQAIDQMRNSKDGAEMVFVPAGEFLMGSEGRDANNDESPEHIVYLDAYWIYKHEVTNEQIAVFLNARGNQVDEGVYWLDAGSGYARIHQVSGEWMPDSGYADHPVVEMSWYGAQAYCTWVGGRLPTEAEWEKAARGEEGRTYPWGEESPTCSLAQFHGCSGQTVPVGSFLDGASPYGALDMAGNVWEWVADWYDPDYYASSPDTNPSGPGSGIYGVLRGSSWYDGERSLHASHRSWSFRNFTFGSIGFRCFHSPEP